MDIRLIGQKTVLSAYTARPAENAGKDSPAPAASAPSPVGDTLVLSRSVQDLYRQTEENLEKELLNPEQSGNEGDALTSGMDVQLRCSKIAARIRAGDKVPLKDQQYLLRYYQAPSPLWQKTAVRSQDPAAVFLRYDALSSG